MSIHNSHILSSSPRWLLLKRWFDIQFSLILFITVFWWLWPIIVILIRLDSPGSAFFKQKRWGRLNKPFTCYKFRTMKKDCKQVDQDGNYLEATQNDPRITRLGHFLRQTNLDELPQFLNILKGDMSVVGPRPHPSIMNRMVKDQIQFYVLRHTVKPGITGWAQVKGYKGEIKSIHLLQKRIEKDIWYIENWTFWLDMKIILLTAWGVIKNRI